VNVSDIVKKAMEAIEAEALAIDRQVCGGRLTSMEAYKAACGKAEGLRMAKDIVNTRLYKGLDDEGET